MLDEVNTIGRLEGKMLFDPTCTWFRDLFVIVWLVEVATGCILNVVPATGDTVE